jgi:hypothetical protein
MNRPLHLDMLELFTPCLFQGSNRRKKAQEHTSAKERSSMLKILKKIANTDVNADTKLKHFSSNYGNIKADADTN